MGKWQKVALRPVIHVKVLLRLCSKTCYCAAGSSVNAQFRNGSFLLCYFPINPYFKNPQIWYKFGCCFQHRCGKENKLDDDFSADQKFDKTLLNKVGFVGTICFLWRWVHQKKLYIHVYVLPDYPEMACSTMGQFFVLVFTFFGDMRDRQGFAGASSYLPV